MTVVQLPMTHLTHQHLHVVKPHVFCTRTRAARVGRHEARSAPSAGYNGNVRDDLDNGRLGGRRPDDAYRAAPVAIKRHAPHVAGIARYAVRVA